MSIRITRHFVTLNGRWGRRQVHYRRSGQGPAVLLLHQSPQSSREMIDLMGRWGLHFTLIAPDTPGYGQSDALGTEAGSTGDLARALAEFVDAIGLRRFGVYGYHTGASIGLWLAAAHPARVTAVAANGLAQFDATERSDLLAHYLPPVIPSWDGSHLAWLWARVREQTMFFPWYERTEATRLTFDVPSPDRLHFSLMEFLRSADHYATAYRAAFDSRPDTVLPGLSTPLLVTAARRDPLHAHLGRLRNLASTTTVESALDGAQAVERCLRYLLSHRGDEAPPAIATQPVPGRLWNSMLTTADGQSRVQLSLEGSGEPLLFLHGAGESSDTARRLVSQLVPGRPVIIPDLPGHGESDPACGEDGPDITGCARAGLHVLDALGISQVVLAGQGTGAWVAMEVSRRGAFGRRRLALIDVPLVPGDLRKRILAQGLPVLTPQWHGGHLLLAWHLLRDSRLFFPWFERSPEGVRKGKPELDPGRLHLELRELLKAEGAWQNLWRSALAYDGAAELAKLPEGLLGATVASAWHATTRAAAGVQPALGHVELPDDPQQWLPAMLRLWR